MWSIWKSLWARYAIWQHTARVCLLRKIKTTSSLHIPYPSLTQQQPKMIRTHLCGELRKEDVGKVVNLAGWLEYNRGNKFFTLRDFTGSCQILNCSGNELPKLESVICVEGLVQLRPHGNVNADMPTGSIEVSTSGVVVLNDCQNFPFSVSDHGKAKEEVRMRHRYWDLRNKQMQHNLRLRSKFVLNVRRFLCEQHGFVDVETPTLFRRTPGGAKEFIVPTQNAGQFYSLPQSPQQFKQLLMAGGIDRYMQIARCYRDEGAKPERQPEFTQLDIELSFTNQEEIKTLIEQMLHTTWPEILPPISVPFARLSYETAMESYGSDKPDTRYDCQLTNLFQELSQVSLFGRQLTGEGATIKGVCIPQGSTRLKSKQIQSIQHSVEEQYKVTIAIIKVEAGCVWKSSLAKHIQEQEILNAVNHTLKAEPGDLVFICAHNERKAACQALGKCRTLASDALSCNGKPLYAANDYEFLWVENFPLFEMEDGVIHSAHHPFTAPVEADYSLLYTDPASARGQHYDLVLNGSEIGGGSIRIHDTDVQTYVIESILGEDSRELSHLLEALASGCPPHGGIALGLDRLLAIMCGSSSIRDVIAFPKSSLGADLMSGAPCGVSSDDLKFYNISVADKK